ncbi:MFS transporter [Streptomyces sp. Amel2xB2]|uniref:MFS transporter n=1 Tax=Streptomyces sp. Amel2xB2 TaxID=1305829 RepID=UPI000DB95506|nr:MFS transporter [Streptomyces sp. Amel2xB2]RAJ69082.1 MFS transporter [Streptomyces sp. Amel2xB2]
MTETAEPGEDATPEHQPGTQPRDHRKLLAAGLIGSSIEWYDFFLYGTAAALVFPHVFFPSSSALTGTLLSFSTFWAGFIARPLGGVLAGHFGDRHGRKPMVVACLLGMGAATFLIGCLPSAATIGVLAPVLLVVLRFVQGLACGGQWGGIVLLLTESTSPKRRGFAGTFGQMGVPFGVILGNVAFLAATAAMPEAAFMSWGWRIPFFFSAVLFPVVLYIQTRVEDSPEFRALQKASQSRQQKVVRAPLGEAVRNDWRKILLACGTLAATNCLFYISIAGVLSYATEELHMSHESLLAVSLLSSLIGAAAILWSGAVSDRVGRRPMILIGAALLVVWAFPYFWLVDTRSLLLFFVALAVGGVFQSMTYGPLAAFIGEMFAPRVRFSGASLAYQLAAITVSGGTPLAMTALIAETGSTTAVSVFVALMGLVTFCCTWALRETNPAEVRDDPAGVPGELLHS